MCQTKIIDAALSRLLNYTKLNHFFSFLKTEKNVSFYVTNRLPAILISLQRLTGSLRPEPTLTLTLSLTPKDIKISFLP